MTLRAYRQSIRMSKITNDGLTRSGTDHWKKGFLTATVTACSFHLQALQQLRSSLPRDVLQTSLVLSVIGSRLDYYMCQTQTSKGYRECRMLLQELFAKLHDVNITQWTYYLHWLPVLGRVD